MSEALIKLRRILVKLKDGEVTPYAEVERTYIIAILECVNWKVRGDDGAAELLKINPSTLYSRMRKLGIKRGR